MGKGYPPPNPSYGHVGLVDTSTVFLDNYGDDPFTKLARKLKVPIEQHYASMQEIATFPFAKMTISPRGTNHEVYEIQFDIKGVHHSFIDDYEGFPTDRLIAKLMLIYP